MGMAVGAALKKIAVALLTDRKVLKSIGMILLVLAVAVIMPLCAFLALLNGTIELDVGMLQQQIMANLSAEDRAMLEGIETTMEEIRTAFKDAGMPERAGEAQAVYIMALYDHSRQPGFVPRLLSCFSDDQSDQQLVSAINREFGSGITVEEYSNVVSNIRSAYIDLEDYYDPTKKNNLDLVQWAKEADAAGWGNASEFITRCIEENLDQIDKRENYVQYIAKRPRVERFGIHGLFTNADTPINLQQVAQEVAEHDGIVMTQILSLRRKDAARLGYDKGEAWRDLIRGKATDMAKAMNIPVQDLRWYAAFHNEGHHPHCHIVAYSVGKQPYMTEQALIHLKSSFAKEIFEQDLIQIYQEQTEYRDALRIDAKDLVAQIVAEINSGTYQNEVVEAMLRELAMRLRNTKGKKV